MSYRNTVLFGLVLTWLLLPRFTPGPALAGQPAPVELKTAEARLLVDAQGRLAIEPADPSSPAPAPFRTPLWVLTLAEGTNVFRPGRQVTVSQAEPPRVSATSHGVRLLYDGIRHGDKLLDIQLDLTITVAGNEFHFGGTLINNCKDRIVTEWKYPILLGIEAARNAPEHVAPALLWPDGLGRRFPTRESFGSHRTADYPGMGGTMQWLAFTHGQTGLYFACHDDQCRPKTFAVATSSASAGYDVSLKHAPYCAPGERWEAPPTVLMPYRGTWHVAARHYRQWGESWLEPLPKAQWAQDSTGWLLAILKQQNGDLMWDYGKLDRLADLAEERGLDTLGLFGWAHGGHDRYYPDYIPDPKMGGPELLKQSIKKVRDRGTRVILYANGQLIDSATEFYRLQGVETMVADPRGAPAFQMYNKFKATSTPIFVTACTAAPAWQERMLALALQAHDLGADGILFDQLGVVGPKQCFTQSHGHKTPTDSDARFELLHKIARHMHQLDPQFIIMTEGVVDAEQADVAYFHGCGPGFFYYEPGPAETLFAEMFRYTYPTFTGTQRAPHPLLTRNFANFACTFGLRFEIESRYTADVKYLTTDEVPTPQEYADCNSPPDVSLVQTVPRQQSAQYMNQVAELRKQHGDLLLRGRFIDVDGLVVEGSGIVAKAFESDRQVGVILWNPGAEPRSARVSVTNCEFSAAYAPGATAAVDRNAPVEPESIRLLVWNRQ
ncbi:MAG: hypothetical protein GXX96_13995 [Planctomycetaceae bacterium]|nr:hypothetical protein [Planctomycetaceae bacterium]